MIPLRIIPAFRPHAYHVYRCIRTPSSASTVAIEVTRPDDKQINTEHTFVYAKQGSAA